MAIFLWQFMSSFTNSFTKSFPNFSGRVFVHSAFDPVAGAFLSSIILRISWGIGAAGAARPMEDIKWFFPWIFFRKTPWKTPWKSREKTMENPMGKPGFDDSNPYFMRKKTWKKTMENPWFPVKIDPSTSSTYQRRELVIYRFVWIMRTIFNAPNFGVVQLSFSCAV